MFKKDFWITFGVAFILAMIVQNIFFSPSQESEQAPIAVETGALMAEPLKGGYDKGEAVSLKIKAASGSTIQLAVGCPAFPFDITKNGTAFDPAPTPYSCEGVPATLDITSEESLVPLEKWTSQVFTTPGDYVLTLKDTDQHPVGTTEVRINDGNFFGDTWHTLFTRPIYNLLIFLSVSLGNNLGFGIIMLTLLARMLLLIPTHRAMESQRAMQKIQPRLKEIQTKHKGDQQRISMETMQIMKDNKVNPVGSCLPLLFQFPILLALFFVIQQGGSASYAVHLYEPLRAVNVVDIQTTLFGLLDLTKPEIFVLPISLALLQFWQLKMSFKKAKAAAPQQKTAEGMPDISQINNVMTYALPVFIAVAAFSLPAGVAVYWLISTFFSIGQQFIVNKERM